MALREEHSEQKQQKWHTRFERERIDFSASVEAALMDNGAVERELLWEDETVEADDATGQGTTVFPPRLSLQSKMQPAVYSESFVESATNTYRAVSSDTGEEQKPATSGQGTGILARLAQRFTSSFAAINPAQKAETPAPEPTGTQEVAPLRPGTDQSSQDARRRAPSAEEALVRIIDLAPPTSSVVEVALPERRKPRILKHNAKVRLQTTELPIVSELPKIEEQNTGETLLADVKDALDRNPVERNARYQERRDSRDTSGLPVVKDALDRNPVERNGRYQEWGDSRDTSGLPVVKNVPATVAHAALAGCSAFESGQSEVMVADPRVTASSVVVVTLTTNPGPVVVQYISLQSEAGFTVHLTAPTVAYTTFNYVVLTS